MQNPSYMQLALAQAKQAALIGEVPVGAVIVEITTQKVLATSHNLSETNKNPLHHAEMLVIAQACQLLDSPRIPTCDLYVTLEPCPMCAQAISFARIRRLYFGAYDSKGGGVEHGARIFSQTSCHHSPEMIGGVEETACSELLKGFFRKRR